MTDLSPYTAAAIDIWKAGVQAVDSQRLVEQALQRNGDSLTIAGTRVSLSAMRRLLVVGGGKAGAGMAAGVEAALGSDLVAAKLDGWVNVPADCVRPLQKIVLHPARPAAVNEPTAEGVFGVHQMLSRVRSLGPADICLVLISGGGSALMPAPIPGVSLDDKLLVTRYLSRAGATIQELNSVRTRLSQIKGGGLLRAIPAGRVFVLIISDVIGDPLEVIASGPTILPSGLLDPLSVLQKYSASRSDLPESVWQAIEAPPSLKSAPVVSVEHAIIGNNRTAMNAAAREAVRRGFTVHDLGTNLAGIAKEVGQSFAETCLQYARAAQEPVCVLSGGEPVVKLAATTSPRRGGRNQELVLAAGLRLWQEDLSQLAVLSGGTDGEDGPTDAAGAWFDAEVRRQANALRLDPCDFLAINNTYPFFAQTGGLLKTGPTHTNVMDVRVGIIGRLSPRR